MSLDGNIIRTFRGWTFRQGSNKLRLDTCGGRWVWGFQSLSSGGTLYPILGSHVFNSLHTTHLSQLCSFSLLSLYTYPLLNLHTSQNFPLLNVFCFTYTHNSFYSLPLFSISTISHTCISFISTYLTFCRTL
jgi:hypothetical protein